MRIFAKLCGPFKKVEYSSAQSGVSSNAVAEKVNGVMKIAAAVSSCSRLRITGTELLEQAAAIAT